VVGFRRTVEEFQEFLVFTPSPDNLTKLEEGTDNCVRLCARVVCAARATEKQTTPLTHAHTQDSENWRWR
jgi:hypothetical protein